MARCPCAGEIEFNFCTEVVTELASGVDEAQVKDLLRQPMAGSGALGNSTAVNVVTLSDRVTICKVHIHSSDPPEVWRRMATLAKVVEGLRVNFKVCSHTRVTTCTTAVRRIAAAFYCDHTLVKSGVCTSRHDCFVQEKAEDMREQVKAVRFTNVPRILVWSATSHSQQRYVLVDGAVVLNWCRAERDAATVA